MDPDQTAPGGPSDQDLYCLPFYHNFSETKFNAKKNVQSKVSKTFTISKQKCIDYIEK